MAPNKSEGGEKFSAADGENAADAGVSCGTPRILLLLAGAASAAVLALALAVSPTTRTAGAEFYRGGAPDSFSVRSMQEAAATSEAGTADGRYAYLGCYADAKGARALPHEIRDRGASLAECAGLCRAAGRRYFLREYRGQCFCGDGGYDRHGTSDGCRDCAGDNVGSYVGCAYELLPEAPVSATGSPSASATGGPSASASASADDSATSMDPPASATWSPSSADASDTPTEPPAPPLWSPSASPTWSPSATPPLDETEVDVVIVGAGWAGLSAGARLLKKGATVAVLEAGDRVGGRARTVYFGDGAVPVDAGAEWIAMYGNRPEETMHGVLRDVTNACGMPGGAALGDYGKTDKGYSSAFRHHLPGEGEMSQRKGNAFMKDLWTGDGGFLEFARKDRKTYSEVLDAYKKDTGPDRVEAEFLSTMLNFDINLRFGVGPEELTPRLGPVGSVGPMLHLAGRFGSLADAYARCEQVSGNIAGSVVLGATATEIDYDAEGGGTAVRYVAGGRAGRIRAKAVLVTVSLGVLKAKQLAFSPPLPGFKADAIEHLGFGVIDKWIGYWRRDAEVPWDTDGGAVWNTLVGRGPPPADGSGENPFRAFYNGYDTNGGHKIFVGFVGGRDAIEGMDERDDAAVHGAAMGALRAMYPGGGEAALTEPDEFKIIRWGRDPHFRGSYSLPGRDRDENSALLAKSVGRKLYFAGEATSDWYGSTTGAYKSGRVAASEILKRLDFRR
eukprot:CAMPEP_0194345450 /NCGR_PEP_ID=MMETSP0171-20130528/104860_1 /TAXON_ID=218684 /ORGANISM="Corethron pennatum, Strain L29A3" /LENGTH=731 /DNA_ID=CAMNT_0039112427 /DNA_START=449 /DNA_END=2647 /DNA_ORIENTATION=-